MLKSWVAGHVTGHRTTYWSSGNSSLKQDKPPEAMDEVILPENEFVVPDKYSLSVVTLFMWVFKKLFIMNIVSFIGATFSRKIQVSISLSTIVCLVALILISVYTFIRYRFLNVYEKVSSSESEYENPKNSFLSTREYDEDVKLGFSSYLEQFLSAIKIFGYLDKPVFHELTRSMKTQRLDKDELFFLDSSIGFAIVVEGSVNVYTKVSTENGSYKNAAASSEDLETENEDIFYLNGERYQLINYVKTGNPLSSLSSILSLFTEIQPPSTVNDQIVFKLANSMQSSEVLKNSFVSFDNDFTIDSDPVSPLNAASDMSNSGHLGNASQSDALPDFLAKAKADCTVAIIPAESFRKLVQKWPRSASHIIQVVLTRLYRVTFSTAHRYFGLTSEIYETEAKLNSESRKELPKYLESSIIRNIKEKNEYTANAANTTDESSNPLKRPKRKNLSRMKSHSRHVILDSKNEHHPGDLLSNVPIARDDTFRTSTFSAEEETENSALTLAVAENIFKYLGIDENTLNSPIIRSGSLQDGSTSVGHRVLSNNSSRRNSFSFSNPMRSTSEHQTLDFEQAKKEFAAGIKFLHAQKGETLIVENSQNKGLYYVISGSLEVFYTENGLDNRKVEKKLYIANKGALSGYLASLIGHKSMVSVRTSSDCYLAFLPQETLNKFCDKYFTIYLLIAKKLIKAISKDLLNMDFAVEWIQAKAGSSLYKQGMDATGIYLILSGRLREIRKKPVNEYGIINNSSGFNDDRDSDKNDDLMFETVKEHAQGVSVGEVEVLTALKRQSTLLAVRDTECARIPRHLFEFLAVRNPLIMIKITRLVSQKLSLSVKESNEGNGSNKNFKTITILPTKFGLPVMEFAQKLEYELKRLNKSVILLNQASLLSYLGKHAFDKLFQLKQSGFFSDLEERYQIIIYVADTPSSSNWTTTCISQGDCILLLADALSKKDALQISEYEKLLIKTRTSARTELVLLHPNRYIIPGSTNNWLKNRVWINDHHHIQFLIPKFEEFLNSNATGSVSDLKLLGNFGITTHIIINNIKSKYDVLKQDFFDKYKGILRRESYYSTANVNKNDIARLARIISGQAIGLVLGGGGARGLAHIGVIQTLEKQGIPIDMIGGTSIGSFIGGLYAKEYDTVSIYGRAKKFSGRVSSIWRTLMDLTYPLVSYTTGHEFNRGVWKAFGDSRIEDFWLKFYCNSTNITNSVMEYHYSGYAWRFIRASMSLCGLVPPIVDPHGNMLLDGGYVDNLPVQEMKRLGAKYVIAVDVGSVDDQTPMKYGDTLSGVMELLNRYNPFSNRPNVPSMADIQMRLAYVGSVEALKKAKETDGVFYFRPPVEPFGTLAFGRFNEIYKVGEEYAVKKLQELRSSGNLPSDMLEMNVKVKTKEFKMQRRNSI